MHRRPQHVVEGRGAGDLAAEIEQVGGAPRGRALVSTCAFEARGQVADDHRDHQEQEERQDVFAVVDDGRCSAAR